MSHPRNQLRLLQRHITTHNCNGDAVFHETVAANAPVRSVIGGDMMFSLMYTNSTFPVSMADEKDIESYRSFLINTPTIAIPGGTVCRTADFPPKYTSPMHRTVSCDFGVVLEGEIELILDSGETRLLKRGDVAVQRGTNHAWRNTSSETWASMLYVLQAAERLVVGDAEMKEDEGGIN